MAPAGSNRSAGPLSRAVDLGAALVVAFSAWRAAGRDRAASARAEAAHAARRARVAEVAEVRRREAAQRGPANPWDRAFDRIDAVQRRFRPLAFAYGVLKKFGDDRAGRMAALIAYYAFFSIFPLMLVLVTVLGFVLEGNEELRQDIVDSAAAQIPVLGQQLADQGLSGNWWALATGLAGALWAGMGAMMAAQDAMNTVWDVPMGDRPNFLFSRVRSLLMMVLLGAGLIGSTALQNLVRVLDDVPLAGRWGIVLGGAALNVVVTALAFRVLTDAPLTARQVVPGAIVGGVGYTVIQQVGSWYFTRVVAGASDTYGTFAAVIGLLSWFYLLGQVFVLAAEVNTVASRRLWPRSFTGRALTPADHEVYVALVEEARRHDDIVVTAEPRPRSLTMS